jgi:hypothetical protein
MTRLCPELSMRLSPITAMERIAPAIRTSRRAIPRLLLAPLIACS